MKTIILISSLLFCSFVANSQNKTDQVIVYQKTAPTYEIKRYSLSSGGGEMSDAAGVYKVFTVIGQIDAGHSATSSPYELKGGLLHGTSDSIFKNGFE